ncbi:MAG: hypothetical protein M1356_04605 [Gammaproteobacteria bacterium]|nr:hypothetical protein [Gammaproteobacteria bacterium]
MTKTMCSYVWLSIAFLLSGSLTVSGQEAGERDPTRPAVRSADAARDSERLPTLTLNLIRSGSQGSSAVINGQTYAVSDSISGWTVISIEPDRVLLERNNEVIVLSVFSGLTRLGRRDDS